MGFNSGFKGLIGILGSNIPRTGQSIELLKCRVFLEVTPCSLAGTAIGPQGFTSEKVAVLIVTALRAPRLLKACGFTYTYFSLSPVQ